MLTGRKCEQQRPLQLFFDSRQLERAVTPDELPELTVDELRFLLAEIELVYSKCKADSEWSEFSTPSEWPDEDWPRRVKRKTQYLHFFLGRVRNAIGDKRQQARVSPLAALKARRQELALVNEERLRSIQYVKFKYIRQVLRKRFGNTIAEGLLREAELLAEKDSQ